MSISQAMNALNKRQTVGLTWLLVVGFGFQSAPKPTHLQLAEQLVSHVSANNTNYQHSQPVVSWKSDTTDYQCHTDCSGFLNALLRQAYGVDRSRFKNWLGASRPYAYHYFEAIRAGNGFQTIRQIQAIQPGDFIAIKYVDRSEHDNNTGHCMLVAGVPQLIPPKPVDLPNISQYEVLVIDSSKSPHGKADSRRISDDTEYDGLGKGQFRLYADNKGNIVGYSWSTQRPKDGFDPLENPIAVGHLTAF